MPSVRTLLLAHGPLDHGAPYVAMAVSIFFVIVVIISVAPEVRRNIRQARELDRQRAREKDEASKLPVMRP